MTLTRKYLDSESDELDDEDEDEDEIDDDEDEETKDSRFRFSALTDTSGFLSDFDESSDSL
jgi:hypothetical protein